MSDDPKQIPARLAVAGEDALVAELLAPPPLEDAEASYDFWRKRRRELPVYRRRARREAKLCLANAEAQLRAARRARSGPTLLEQLSETVGITISVARVRRVLMVAALSLVVLLSALVAAGVAFWSEIEPIVRFLVGNAG